MSFDFQEFVTKNNLPKETEDLLVEKHFTEAKIICRLNNARILKLGLEDGEAVRLDIAVEELRIECGELPPKKDYRLEGAFTSTPSLDLPRPIPGLGNIKKEFGSGARRKETSVQHENPDPQGAAKFTEEQEEVTTKTLQKDPKVSELLAYYLSNTGLGDLTSTLGLPTNRPPGSDTSITKGEKPLLIKDFIKSTLKYQYSEDTDNEVLLAEGTRLLVSNKTKKPEVEDFTIELWHSANYRIILHLLKQHTSFETLNQYIEYSSWISDYLDIYIPRGVFLLDDQHRRRVADEKRQWNNLYWHDVSQYLVVRKVNSEEKVEQSKRSKSFKKSSRKGRPTDSNGTPICGNYNNQNGCSYGETCRFSHLCNNSNCNGKHPRHECPRIPPRLQHK